MLDRVLALPGHRRGAAAPHEVALLEKVEVWLLTVQQVDHRADPEDPSDDGRCLERRFLHRRKSIHPRRQDGMDRVGHREPRSPLPEGPLPVPPLENARVEELADELLEEEGV
ncbi:MAG: hypothetical protein M3435_02685, partial [Actinomycetota bacterium]|nr:hypothetical protein [Actinomycetota bacterium]